MVNKPLIRPYFLGGVVVWGGVERIPMIQGEPPDPNPNGPIQLRFVDADLRLRGP